MREVKPTQKPVPSSDIKDLFFNSGLLDIWATSLEHKYIDRFGNCHLTSAGMEWIFNELVTKFKIESEQALLAAGYVPAGTFQEGADVASRNSTVLWKLPDGDGDYYRWDGDLPKQVPAGSTPQSTGGVGKGAWVSVGDASLRSELSSKDGSLNVSYKYPINESIKRTVQSKLDEKISILDLGAKLDGVTDDTDAFIKAVAVCDTLNVKLWIPTGTCLINKPVKSPRCGMYGDGHMSSKILVDIADATDDTFAITYGDVGEYRYSYGKIHDIKVAVKDESSKVSLFKINTTSRGAIMQDCTLHVGSGWCITMEECFYYNYQNVTFEGKFIHKDEITQDNELKGGAVRCVGTEINNIHFNNCDMRYLKTVFKGTGTFVGSNSIKVSNAAIESIGDSLGDIAGWNVDFDCMYIEGIGLNKHNTNSLTCCLLKVGAGTSNFNNCLINLGSCRKDKPVFTGVIGRVRLDRTSMDMSGRTAPIMEPITYSARSMLEIDNSSCLPQSAADNLGSQWVGGYRGRDSTMSPVMAASDISLNSYKFRWVPKLNIYSLNDQSIGYVNFNSKLSLIVSARANGAIVVDNKPYAVEFITYFKFSNGIQVGRSTSVITNGASWLAGFTPESGLSLNKHQESAEFNMISFYLKTGNILAGANKVDIFLDFEVSIIFEDRNKTVRGISSEY